MTHAVPEVRRRGRPPRISRERIVEAAFELGIENLTMNAVAERLGVTHQSLYGWVRDRDELVDFVSDQLIDAVDLPATPDPSEWRAVLQVLANGLRQIAQRAPGFAEAALVRFRTSPGHLRLNDRVVRELTIAGFEPAIAQRMYETVTTATLGWLAREDASTPLRSRPAPFVHGLDGAAASGIIRPATAEAAAVELSAPDDERFGFLVQALIAGFVAPPPDKPVETAEELDLRDADRPYARPG